MTGRVQFAIGNADDVLLFREQEAPILALLAPIQNTPRCIMVRADSPAQSLDQLAGMTLQANVGRPFLTFMENRGLLKEVRVVPYSGSVANFVSDTNTAIQAYAFSEPLLAQQQGVSTRQLMLSDVGFNPYASCLITTENYASEREDVVQRMVSACREGWAQYFEDASRSNAAILADNPHGMTQEALEFGVKELRPLCLPEGLAVEDVGSMDLQRWQALVDQFAQLGLLDAQKVPASAVFTTKYLEQSKAQVAE